ncbi:MAG TPA: hypothetical protein VJW20_10370 [Candidatus Angelobacter sp.]|nr:hypothetical protein [Candidatus Angelobacter sp.]
MRGAFRILSIFSLSILAAGQALTQSSLNRQLSLPQQSSSTLTDPSYQASFPPVVANGLVTAKWERGRMVSFGTGSTLEPIQLYDKSGALIFEAPLKVEGAAKFYVRDVSVSTPNSVAVAMAAVTEDGAIADFIAEVQRNGINRIIRTSPFRAAQICTTDDGMVWAYGWERDSTGADRHGDYAMLREFSFEHGQLRSAIKRSEVRLPSGVPVTGSRQEVQLICGREKLVLLNGAVNKIVEYDLQHSSVTKANLPELPQDIPLTSITGAALSASGELYVSTQQSGNLAQTGIFRLNLKTQAGPVWDVVASGPSAGKWFHLLGSDGSALVYSRGVRSSTVYWSAMSASEVAK